MLLSDNIIREHVSKGMLVQNMKDPEIQIQPCGIDLTIGKIMKLKGKGELDFDNSKRKICEYEEVQLEDGKWDLTEGVYHIIINEMINLPKNIAGKVLPRSSALGCGIEIHSALWDPGYNGRGSLHMNISKEVIIHKDARFGQMIFITLQDESSGYSGVYQGEDAMSGKRGLVV